MLYIVLDKLDEVSEATISIQLIILRFDTELGHGHTNAQDYVD
jgi:hypothetical protein